MLGTLLTLGSIAVGIGAQHIADKIQRDKSRKRKVTSDDIIKYTEMILSEAEKKGNSALNRVLDRLSEIKNSRALSSGNVRNYINTVVSKERDKLEALQDDIQKSLIDINSARNRSANLANQTDTFKNSKAGQQSINDLKQQVNNLNQQIDQKVDKYV